MEPISTALMAVSAASASIKFLKERISDAQDAKEIFGHVFTAYGLRKGNQCRPIKT
jgi:hypothetical protein